MALPDSLKACPAPSLPPQPAHPVQADAAAVATASYFGWWSCYDALQNLVSVVESGAQKPTIH